MVLQITILIQKALISPSLIIEGHRVGLLIYCFLFLADLLMKTPASAMAAGI